MKDAITPRREALASQLTRTGAYNPRYLAYCRDQGQSDPEKMLELDAVAWPGGLMCGFILWMDERLREFNKLQGCSSREECHLKLGAEWHPLFDAYLDKKYPRKKGNL